MFGYGMATEWLNTLELLNLACVVYDQFGHRLVNQNFRITNSAQLSKR